MDNQIIVNSKITFYRIMLIIFCIVIPLAPFIIAYLIISWKPTDIVESRVISKRTTVHFPMNFDFFLGNVYYITIETKELEVSGKIYEMLAVGDYISVAYRNDTLYYFKKFD